MTDSPTAARAREDALAARFLRYSAISSQSDASATVVPTSEGQRELAELLAAELREAGAADVHVSETAVVTAKIPSNLPADAAPVDAIGFCAHLDTVDVDLSPVVRARVVDYSGGDLRLSEQGDAWIRVDEHPEIGRYAGQRILVTDGTSVLGADDKAAIASIMETACGLLAADRAGSPEALPHGDVYVSFVPDEEIGLRGVRTMDLDRFPVRFAYTFDSCELGEVVEETFNAGQATIDITGVSAHPMSAKGVLVNPILVAHDIVASLDREQTPECTEGREGYIWVNGIRGDQTHATISASIRDHDLGLYEEKKETLRAAVAAARARHPRAEVEIDIVDVYGNIADAKTEENAVAAERIHKAMAELGITPIPLAMRGGTDGSYLSRQGIFTPNVFTGAHNFHSPCEFLPLPAFERSAAMCRELIRLTALGG